MHSIAPGLPVLPSTTVALVACGAAKRDHQSPAWDLYLGSLFRLSAAWANAHAGQWAILSARHGLLDPQQVIDPYNARLPARREHRMPWERQVAGTFLDRWADSPGPFVLLAGEAYTTWTGLLPEEIRARFLDPLKSLFIGQRLHVLRDALDGRRPLLYPCP